MASMQLPADFSAFLSLLNSEQVERRLRRVNALHTDLADLKANTRVAGRRKDLDDVNRLP